MHHMYYVLWIFRITLINKREIFQFIDIEEDLHISSILSDASHSMFYFFRVLVTYFRVEDPSLIREFE